MANKKFSDLEVAQIDDLNAESTYMPVEEADTASKTVSIKLSDLLAHGGGSGGEYIDKTNGIGYGELSIRQEQGNLPNLSIQASTVGQTFRAPCNIALGEQNTVATQNIVSGRSNNISAAYDIAIGDGNITTAGSHNIIIGNGSTINGSANIKIGTDSHLILGDNNYVNTKGKAYIAGTSNIVYGSAPLGYAGTVANIGSNNIINVSSGANFGSFGTSNLVIASAALGDPTINTKNSLIAGGNQSSMSGEGILAIGTQNYSNGSTGSIVFGNQSSVHNAKGAISGGYRAQAYGDFAISIGQDATAYSNSLAFGQNVVAAGASSPSTSDTNVYSTIGFGAYTSALGQGSLGGGSHTTILGNYSVGIGYNINLNGNNNASFGCENNLSGDFNASFGYGDHLSGDANGSFGSQNTVNGSYNAVGGFLNNISNPNTTTTANYNVVFGQNNTVYNSNYNSITGTKNQITDSSYSHTDGYMNIIGEASHYGHAEGVLGVISQMSVGSHVEGYGGNPEDTTLTYNRALNGKGVHVEGYNNQIGGNGGHVEGANNIGNQGGDAVHIEGKSNSVAAGPVAAHVEGYMNAITSGSQPGAHIGGMNNTVGLTSTPVFVHGMSNTVSSIYTLGNRNNQQIPGVTGNIFGDNNYIGNATSVTALGNCNTITKAGSIAMLSGEANTTNNAILAIGNGAVISSGAGNLVELTADGYMSLHDYTGGYVEPTNDTHITTKKYVDDKIVYLYVLQNGSAAYCSSTPDTLTTVTSSAIDNMFRDVDTHLPTGKQVYLVASSTLTYTDGTVPLEIASLVKSLDTNTGKVIFGIFDSVSKYWTVDASGVVVGTTV